ncbi:hypothetical protein Lalb_Chr10g0098071 [Lupinus albus]|uniref:Uncharacterized protein n=1 Tax=Lupinus albus TaxID=3870 RepID=A0A6A4PW27_LUPAL|nr:hypothetical protein Lalb_Chr10g0098071 [Lupinus albus]
MLHLPDPSTVWLCCSSISDSLLPDSEYDLSHDFQVNCGSVFACSPICWGLVFKLRLRHVRAAFAIAISYWLNVIGHVCIGLSCYGEEPNSFTRVSNEIGVGNPKAAQGTVRVVVIIGIVEAVIVSTFFYCWICL